jgi:hypothetical protein
LAAISAIFTINHVAKMLGEDDDWLHELSIDMFPEAAASTSTASVRTA